MKENLLVILLHYLAVAQGNDEPDLPICPTNVEFFPQNLPMHCRLGVGRSSDLGNGLPNIPTVMPPLPPGFQSPPPGAQPAPIPVPFPPVPGGMPMPGPMPGPIPGSMVGPMPPGMQMAMPGPMPMPMPMASMGGPNHKLPVIVMPFYSPDPGYKKPDRPKKPRNPPKKKRRRPKKPLHSVESSSDTDTDDTSSEDSDTDTSSETSDQETWKGFKKEWRKNAKNTRRSSRRRHKKKKELLTPVLQYITRDGYVVFEKKITKGEATDWLKTDDSKRENKNENNKPDKNDEENDNEDDKKDAENTTPEPKHRPERLRQFHIDGKKKLNYEQI